RALRADRPVLVDARTDKNVPPLPPHVTLEQATGDAKALLGGDPDGTKVVGITARDLAAHLFACFDRSDDACATGPAAVPRRSSGSRLRPSPSPSCSPNPMAPSPGMRPRS